ncbi:MAG TPA: branched-chain amino acid ABC transporter permease [Chloroflexi bacterium]|jgi:branched-chain amino acid transport system permease protein|nr:branched-chain amino acid ABC transporter permease [Chloroflexota bacterium]
MLFTSIINGLLLGGMYAAVGVGFSLVWGVMNTVNLSHGAMIMLGAYTTYWMSQYIGVNPLWFVPVAMLVTLFIGYLLQKYVINLTMKSGTNMTLILSHGFNLFLVNAAYILWKGDYRSIQSPFSGQGLNLFGTTVPYSRLIVFVIAIIVAILLQLFLSRTKTGTAIRATAQNKDAAQLVGVNISRIYSITFAIGCGLAGVAGALMSTNFVVTPTFGDPFIGRAFAVAVLGGLGTVSGAVLGGLVLGLAETLGALAFGPSFQNAIAFAILVLVLVIRPQGLMGKKFF